MSSEIIKYKGLRYRQNKSLRYLEVIIDNDTLSNNENYVFAISNVAEFTIYIRPMYLVINLLNSSFRINKDLIGFTKNNILRPLHEYNVQKVIFLVDDSVYNENYFEIKEKDPLYTMFKNVDDMNKWITENSPNANPKK